MYLSATRLVTMPNGGDFLVGLRKFNIRHVEQLVSLMDSAVGLRSLTEVFGDRFDWGEVKKLLRGSDVQAITMPGLSTSLVLDRGNRPSNNFSKFSYGLASDGDFKHEYRLFNTIPEHFWVNEDEVRVVSQIARLKEALNSFPQLSEEGEPSGRVCLHPVGAFPPPKDQGSRGTCAAFSASAQLQLFIREHVPKFRRVTDFSEQFIYYTAKTNDGRINEEGTTLYATMSALQESGVCAQSTLPYRPYVDWAQTLLFDNSFDLANVKKLAKGTKIASFFAIPGRDRVEWIKSCLRRRLPVSLGVLTFKEAWGNDYAIWRGEIGLPLIRTEDDGKITLLDDCDGGHAVCVVGYVDQPSEELSDRPGGGYFIFRNSWGLTWAEDSSEGRGYGMLPYEYVKRYGIEACVITGVTQTANRDESL